ncbi:hypothetical protein BHE74_00005570 [Ensete ventricosum]|nr:hypothetical protein BHE74_00005570 [Ensete ventricosum]RZR99523.1 hypothetical protein BHM03_00029092 [Ensete ventricosum]
MNPGTLSSRVEENPATSDGRIAGKEPKGPVPANNSENSERCPSIGTGFCNFTYDKLLLCCKDMSWTLLKLVAGCPAPDVNNNAERGDVNLDQSAYFAFNACSRYAPL